VNWLVRSSGSGVGHINKVKLRRARIVLGLVTTFGGSTIRVSIQTSQTTQPGHPSVGRFNEYWQWFPPLLGRNGEFYVAVALLPGPLACWHIVCYSLIGSHFCRLKGQGRWVPSRRISRSLRISSSSVTANQHYTAVLD